MVSLPRCPNLLDPAPQQAVLSDPQPPSPAAQTRRFTISTFQFLPDGEFKDTNEEVRINGDLILILALMPYLRLFISQ